MHRLANGFRRAAHVLVASLALHVGHTLTCDRMKDAYADVGLDHGAQFVEHVIHIGEDR